MRAMVTPKDCCVCAIIATFNRRELLRRLLNSLAVQTFRDFDVVVVDNASTDGTAEMVRRDFPAVHLIVLDRNTGASGGNNVGLRYAITQGYRFGWLLDNDAVTEPTTLAKLIEVAEHYPRAAMIASKILVLDGNGALTQRIHEVGGAIDWWHGALISCGNGQLDDLTCANTFINAEYVAMTSLLLRSDVLRQHGLLRDEFFVFGEDVELSLRYRRRGYPVGVASASRVWHLQGAHKSTTPLREYYTARNYLFLFWEAAPGLFKIPSLFHHLRRSLNLMFTFWLDGQREFARAIWNAITSFYRGQLIPYQPALTHIRTWETQAIELPRMVERVLIVSRGGMDQLLATLARVRATLPQSTCDVLLLHYFDEQIDFASEAVRHVWKRPSNWRDRLRLIRTLNTQRYDVAIPTDPALTLLYESTARYILEWQTEEWQIRQAHWARKLSERVLASLTSYLIAIVLMLALPLRALPSTIRRYPRRGVWQ